MGWQDAPVLETNPKWMQAPTVEATPAPQPEQEASFTDKLLGAPGTRFVAGLASPFVGAAQLGAHGMDALTGSHVAPMIDKSVSAYEAAKHRGMKALGNEGYDFMGLLGSLAPSGLAAKSVTGMLPQAASLPTKMISGGAAGATAGAVQPVNSPDFWSDKGAQVGGGAALGAAAPLAAQGVMAGKALFEPFYKKGQDAIIGRALNTAAGQQAPSIAAAMQNAQPILQGSLPTVGQASQNAGLASLERAVGASVPEATNAFAQRAAEQNAARAAALGTVAKDENAMAAAIQARKAATAPLIQQVTESTAEVNPSRTVSLIDKLIKASPGRTQLTSTLENVKKSLFEENPLAQRAKESWKAVNDTLTNKQFGLADTEALGTARTVLDRARKGTIDAEEALEQLKGLKPATQPAKDALQAVKDALKAPDQRLRSNASELYQGARKNITDLLHAKAGDGSKLNEAISRELTVVMKSLDHQINKAEPAYGQFMQKFAEQSKPINQMQIGQEIQKKATNATGDVQLNPLVAALSDKTAQRATGFKRATMAGTMDPSQMATLNSVKDDLIRAVQARNMAGTAGSDTVRKLAYSNLVDRAGVPTFLREFAPTQTIGNLLARGADSVYGKANRELQQRLADTMLNPAEAGRMMQQVGPSRFSALIDALIQQASVGGGTVAGRGGQ